MNQTEILRQERLKKAELEAKDKRHTELVGAVNNQTATTIKAFNAFTKYVDRKITKTEVVNQLKARVCSASVDCKPIMLRVILELG